MLFILRMKHTCQNDILKAASVKFGKQVRLTTWENNISCKQAVFHHVESSVLLNEWKPKK